MTTDEPSSRFSSVSHWEVVRANSNIRVVTHDTLQVRPPEILDTISQHRPSIGTFEIGMTPALPRGYFVDQLPVSFEQLSMLATNQRLVDELVDGIRPGGVLRKVSSGY